MSSMTRSDYIASKIDGFFGLYSIIVLNILNVCCEVVAEV